MIRLDIISKFLILLAFSELVFVALYGGPLANASFIAIALILGGITLDRKFKVDDEEEELDESDALELVINVAIDIGVFYLLNVFVPQSGVSLFIQKLLQVPVPLSTFALTTLGSVFAYKMFNLLIAVAEEVFFRYLIGNIMLKGASGRWAQGFVSIGNGFVFMLFHFAVYGNNPNALAIVWVAGAVLTFSDIRTQRVSTSMIAHVANNLLS